MDLSRQDRTPGKQKHVADALRTEIVSGLFRPGTRMPTQLEMVNRFGVSGVTVQQALSQLIREGFIYTLPRQGTFVASAPPHLCHYGIIFHTSPLQGTRWPQFWVALGHEAVAMQQAGDRRLTTFYGIHGWQQGADYHRLTGPAAVQASVPGFLPADSKQKGCCFDAIGKGTRKTGGFFGLARDRGGANRNERP